MVRIRDHGVCPECGAEWKYKFGKETYSHLIGIEVTSMYDGVSFWQCPSCKTLWDRWSDEKVDKLPEGH
jgi:rubredoxin